MNGAIQVAECQIRRGLAEPCLCEREQQPGQRIPVGCVEIVLGADVALAHEPIGGSNARSTWRHVAGGLHGVASHRRSRLRRAASSINSGQAEEVLVGVA